MTLKDAIEGKEYIIEKIETDDEELDAFLFSLGCYSGEKITVVSHLKGGCVVSIKDARYNIDNQKDNEGEITMTFIQPCFIRKNTLEQRQMVEKLVKILCECISF